MITVLLSLALAGPRGVLQGQDPPPGLEEAYESRRVALVFGIDHYADPALGELRYAAKDAADLASLLRDPAIGGYDVVSEVTGDVYATEFWAAFDAVAAGIQRDDTVMVYVAAHGTLDLEGGETQLFIMPSDAWLATPAETGVAVTSLAERVEALPARRTVLVLDTCHSGNGRSAIAPDVRERIERMRGPVPSPAALHVSSVSAHLYAAHVNQPALEDPGLQNGVYTHFLLAALRGAADVDGDGLVEVMEAHGWARDRTLEFSGGSQVPWAETVVVGREAIYLSGNPSMRRAAEQAILTGLEGLPVGAQVSVDGIVRGAGMLQEGPHDLEVTHGSRLLLDTTKEVQAGENLHLDRLIDDRSGHLAVTVGGVLGLDRAWLGTSFVDGRLTIEPPDPSGMRWVFGVAGSVGRGPAVLEASPAGTATLFAGPRVSRGDWRLGPDLGLGWAWRFAPRGAEGTPTLVPGIHSSHSFGGLVLAFGADIPLFPAEGRVSASPRAGVAIGFQP